MPAIHGRALIIASDERQQLGAAVGDFLLDPRAIWAGDAAELCFVLERHQPAMILVSAALPNLLATGPIRALGTARRRGPPVILCGREHDERLSHPVLRSVVDTVVELPDATGRISEAIRLTMTVRGEPAPRHGSPALRRTISRARDALHDAIRSFRSGQPPDGGGLLDAADGISGLAGSPELRRMPELLRAHHDPTYTHSLRVAASLALFGHAIGIRADELRMLALAGLMHDIGKATLPRWLLEKPGALVEPEWRLVRRHPLAGDRMLRQIGRLPPVISEVAANHHERLDGSGYPHGLAGLAIDEPSLLCAIVDMHIALTEPRAYKRALSDEEAFAIIERGQHGAVEAAFLRRYRELMLDTAAAG